MDVLLYELTGKLRERAEWDRRTGMTKLIVAFRNFANAPSSWDKFIKEAISVEHQQDLCGPQVVSGPQVDKHWRTCYLYNWGFTFVRFLPQPRKKKH